MITLIEALNFRCLRYIRQPLEPFHVLVGPNASGKSTFLDVVAFLGQLVSDGLEAAIQDRTRNFEDLIWRRSGHCFELAIEAKVPNDRKRLLGESELDTVRYEVALSLDKATNEVVIANEKALLKKLENKPFSQRDFFPELKYIPQTILTSRSTGTRTIINKVPGGNDNFYSEVHGEKGKGWVPSFRLGPRKSALGNLPADETRFPVATWLKDLLTEGVQQFILNSSLIKKASAPGQGRGFRTDGSNLPWVIENLRDKHPSNFRNWIAHLQTALPEIHDIKTIERSDDKHRYIVVCYQGGLEIPSWMVSDGTLRLLALTLPAYLSEFSGIYLIEEPENGIHPRAVETVFQSLSSVYTAQILMATHSPVILGMVDADKVLCFAKTEEGITDIVLGSNHPKLKEWRNEENLGVLFAGGVLG